MRMQRRSGLVQGAAANVASVPAPVGGWNARDSLANMDPSDAVTLTNFFPTPSSVTLRGGYTQYSTGISGQVETVMNYSAANSDYLYSIAGTSIYDSTSAGAVGAAKVTGLTNARWEYINVATPGGNYLYAVNGFDAPLLYDGTTWQAVTGVSAPFAITGVTTTTLDNVTLFKNRVWFVQKSTLKAWYLPTSSIAGAAQVLDLTSIAMYGGHLVAAATWTVDAGYGMDDNLVFITNNGEVIVYRGTDPASAATWALAGVFKLGSPIGKRCFLKWAGDLLVLTTDGLLPMAQAIQSSRLDPRVALSDKIQGAFASAINLYAADHTAFGWEIVYSAKQNAVFVNIPVAVGSQQQYVMNTITKSWCNFTGWAANCWTIMADTLYFGGNGYVGQAWTDNNTDNVSAIQTNVISAFDYYGKRGVKKYFTRARPSIFTDGVPSIFVGMNVDFDLSDTTAALSFSPTSYALWDVGVWDSSTWGQDLTVTNNWQGITGLGYCGAVHLKTSSSGLQIQWSATDVVYQTGWAGI